jgi:dTDP-4-amino-4,6-dideoxygalactose transaminase
MQTAYQRFPSGQEDGSLPVSEDMAQRVMSLPMHPYLTQEQQDYICETVGAFFSA